MTSKLNYISKKELQNITSQFYLPKFELAEKRGNEPIHYRYNVYYEKFNTRINNLLTDENTMEYLFTLKDFPVSLSCVPVDLNHNKTLDMIFEICKKTGIIQIKNAPALNDIYISPHNSSYGKVWYNLFEMFFHSIEKTFCSCRFRSKIVTVI